MVTSKKQQPNGSSRGQPAGTSSARREIVEIGRKVVEEDRETLDLLAAYDRDPASSGLSPRAAKDGVSAPAES